MRTFLTIAITCAVAAATPLCAQTSDVANELSGQAGYRMRTESGRSLGGFTVEIGYAPAVEQKFGWELAGAYSQISAYGVVNSAPVTVRENSIDGSVRARYEFVRTATWNLEGAVGPLASFALGCTSGGGAGANSGGYGQATCVNSFASSGMRFGGDLNLRSIWRAGSRARFMLGVSAAGGSVAAGNSVALGVSAGLRVSLNPTASR